MSATQPSNHDRSAQSRRPWEAPSLSELAIRAAAKATGVRTAPLMSPAEPWPPFVKVTGATDTGGKGADTDRPKSGQGHDTDGKSFP